MNIKKILTDSGVGLVRVTVTALRGILLLPIITKFISVEAYAVWTLIFATVSVLMGLGNLYLFGALVRYRPEENRKGQTLSDLLVISVISSVLTGIIAFVIMGEVIPLSGQSAWGLTIPVIGGMLVATRIMGLIVRNVPRSEGNVKIYEIIIIIEKTFSTVTLVLVLFFTRNIAAGLLSITVALFVTYTVLSLMYLPGRVKMPKIGNFKKYFVYSSPLALQELLEKLFTQSDRFVILFFLSPAAVGVYSAAYGISAMFSNLTRIFNGTLFPTVTAAWENDEIEELNRFYVNFTTGYLLLAIPALFGIALLSRPILEFLATEQIAEQGWILVPLLALSFIFHGFENVLTYVLKATKETGHIAKSTVIALVTNVLLNIILIPIVGLAGSAVAMIVGMFVRMVYIYYHVRTHVTILVPKTKVVKSVVGAVLMSVLLLSLSTTLNQVLYQIAFFPIIGCLTYFAVVYYLGGISKSNLVKLKSLLQ